MNRLPNLRLPENWKHRRTPLIVAPKKPRGVLAPLVSAEAYEADRRRSGARQEEREASPRGSDSVRR